MEFAGSLWIARAESSEGCGGHFRNFQWESPLRSPNCRGPFLLPTEEKLEKIKF